MIPSIYEDFFETLLRGIPLQVTTLAINERSMLTQWSRFKKRQFGASWLKYKTLRFTPDAKGSMTTITLVDSSRKRTPITFATCTCATTETNPHAETNVPTTMGANQTG